MFCGVQGKRKMPKKGRQSDRTAKGDQDHEIRSDAGKEEGEPTRDLERAAP